MIHCKKDYRIEVRDNMRGGNGSVQIEHLWQPGSELLAATRMCSRVTLEPGASIGFHRHENEEEIFYIISGEAMADDNGKEVKLTAGETLLTGNGAGHAITNCGQEPLQLFAIINKY